MRFLPIDGADSDRINAVGVAVEVTLIVHGAAVAARKDEDASLAAATFLHAVENGFEDEPAWSLHALPVVRRSPAAAINVIFLVAVVERRGFIGVADGSGEDPNAGDFGIEGDADATNFITLGSDLASTSSPVLIVRQARFG